MNRKWNTVKECRHFHNSLRWDYQLFRLPFGKGSGLRISAYGKETEFGYVTFSIQRQNDYSCMPQRRKNVMESVYKNYLIHSTGICWICGEIHPRVLERHHLYESRAKNKHKNTMRDDFVSGICANCHRKRRVTGGETERHQIAVLKAIEKEWFGLGGK